MFTNGFKERLREGAPTAIAVAISAVEKGGAERRAITLFARTHAKPAHVVGVTGPGGSGKSTLINRLVATWLAEGKRVGVVGIDPSSPRSGGALLGDRMRITHCHDPRFYMRSMATRGNRRGIVAHLQAIINILACAKKDIVIVETVGAAQDATAIRDYVHTLVYVLTPVGDWVTHSKAGLVEVADILVMNYGDEPNAERVANELNNLEELSMNNQKRPVIKTTAIIGGGIEELKAAIEEHGKQRRR